MVEIAGFKLAASLSTMRLPPSTDLSIDSDFAQVDMRARDIDNGKEMFPMMLHKEVKTLGMPWEGQYGYVQAVKVDDTIYVSGQLSHDDRGNMIGAAPLDDSGNIRDHSNMEIQMRQSYANAKKVLGGFGVTLENVVEEVLYVTNMEKAFAAAGPVRKEAYGSQTPQVASTILVTPRLALPTQLIEIKLIAKMR